MLFDGMQPGRSAATPTFQGMCLFAYINEQAAAAFSTHTSRLHEHDECRKQREQAARKQITARPVRRPSLP